MSYFKLLDTLKAQLNATNLISTVTDGQISDIDLAKQTLFPLAHIIVNSATIEGKLQRFNVTILAMDILDGKEKYDVEPSIMNAMLQSLNRVYEIMTRGDLNPDYIMIDGSPTLEPFTDRFENKLAGWAMTFDVAMMSEMTVCNTGFTSGCPNVTVTDGATSVQVLAGGTYTCNSCSVTTGTNTGDETKASIESKLGLFHIGIPTSAILTGTTSPTQLAKIEIPANSINLQDSIRIYTPLKKIGGAGVIVFNYKLSTLSTMPSGTTARIATFTCAINNLWIPMQRNPSYSGGDLIILLSSVNVINDLSVSPSAPSIIEIDRTVTQYLYIEATLGNSGDSVYLLGGHITNM